jgi:GNAT superfamily N-acetyltransferase
VAYAGLKQSSQWLDAGYLNRCGVSFDHRGHGLQRRLLRCRERRARRNGWRYCITDTTDNLASANSLIKAGSTLYRPSQVSNS